MLPQMVQFIQQGLSQVVYLLENIVGMIRQNLLLQDMLFPHVHQR